MHQFSKESVTKFYVAAVNKAKRHNEGMEGHKKGRKRNSILDIEAVSSSHPKRNILVATGSTSFNAH